MRPSLLWLQWLRLSSGMVLLAFVLSHLANLALGLVSLDLVESWHPQFIDAWQSMAGRALLTLCAGVHSALGLYAIAMRRALAFSLSDASQWCLALAIPPLLASHILSLRVAGEIIPDFDTGYAYALAVYWSYAPAYAILQLLALIAVWTHGAIGLYGYLSLQPSWRRIGGFITPLLFAVPLLSVLGFVEAGKEVLDKLEAEPAFKMAVDANWARAQGAARLLGEWQMQFLAVYGALAALAVAILLARMLWRSRSRLTVAYDGGEMARAGRGQSILEFSMAAGVAHASVCGGRGRCGTCRVEILRGAGALSPIGPVEARTLARVRAPQNVRLACQARVLGEGLEVARVLPAFADASAARDPDEWVEASSQILEPQAAP